MSKVILDDSWPDRFCALPIGVDTIGYTKIVCTHPYHAMAIFYLSLNEWQDNIRPLLTPYWINHYIVVMHPMD